MVPEHISAAQIAGDSVGEHHHSGDCRKAAPESSEADAAARPFCVVEAGQSIAKRQKLLFECRRIRRECLRRNFQCYGFPGVSVDKQGTVPVRRNADPVLCPVVSRSAGSEDGRDSRGFCFIFFH